MRQLIALVSIKSLILNVLFWKSNSCLQKSIHRQIMEVDDLTDHLTADENRAYLLDLVPQP
jgi:hypothetical protein